MSRTLPAAILTALAKDEVNFLFAVDIDFDSGSLYMWNGYGNLSYDGKTYLGSGQVMNLSSIEETSEIEAKGASITVTGIPSSFLSLALSEPYQGRECRIYFGTYDVGVYTFQEIFTGELDQMNISEEGSTSTITVTVESVLIKLERPTIRRYTHEDQKSRYPDDKGLEFISSLPEKEIVWGKK